MSAISLKGIRVSGDQRWSGMCGGVAPEPNPGVMGFQEIWFIFSCGCVFLDLFCRVAAISGYVSLEYQSGLHTQVREGGGGGGGRVEVRRPSPPLPLASRLSEKINSRRSERYLGKPSYYNHSLCLPLIAFLPWASHRRHDSLDAVASSPKLKSVFLLRFECVVRPRLCVCSSELMVCL